MLRKKEAELFFVGFHKPTQIFEFQSMINSTMREYDPPRVYFKSLIRLGLPTYKYVQTNGYVGKVVNVKNIKSYYPNTLYVISVYILASHLEDDVIVDIHDKTLKYYIKEKKEAVITKTMKEEKYIKLERVITKVINPNIILLKEPFP